MPRQHPPLHLGRSAGRQEPAVVIGADTIVLCGNKIFGKPSSKKDAAGMLGKLSGRRHSVITGVAVKAVPAGRLLTDSVVTSVKFKRLSEKEIKDYVESAEPMDKAGAYAAQGKASAFIEEIRGCFFNVVGLPLNRLASMLKKTGVPATRL